MVCEQLYVLLVDMDIEDPVDFVVKQLATGTLEDMRKLFYETDAVSYSGPGRVKEANARIVKLDRWQEIQKKHGFVAEDK